VAAAMEQSFTRAQEEAAAKKAATAAFVSALGAMRPPVSPASEWAQVAAALPDDAAYAVLTEPQRRAAFAAYAEVLRRAARAAAERAVAALEDLFAEVDPPEGSTYAAAAERVAKDPRFAAVVDEADRVAAFKACMAARRAARERAARAELASAAAAAKEAAAAVRSAEAEAAFRALMQRHEALVAGGASWGEVKRAMWADPRWDAVQEPRRKELHAEYVEILKEAGVQPPAAPAAAAPPTAPAATQESFEYLREEQARMPPS